ncbi:TPA: methyltransferase [Candidatus Woesearchaeota archaeon]|nr:rRNA (Guanine-N(2)-)-methyltransferase [archaeon GW2011_AR15]MBS3103485.1 methyltransferase [Candidatus Woesearchaeota archaeon]HIH41603.1 methyltransferase [Candidatus Woesearchaeota archaeon]
MHEAIAITNKGAEDVAAEEIKELIGSKAEVSETLAKFSIKDYSELCTVCYRSQSISKAVLLLFEFKVEKELDKTVKNLTGSLKKDGISEWFLGKYKVESGREGEHDFHSVDVGAEASKCLFELMKKTGKPEIDYDLPDVIFYIYIYGNSGYFGVDFAGIDLSKRQYKIFNHPEALKGTTGYAVLRKAGIKKDSVIVDPFMGSGVIVIEAALYAMGFPVHYYSKDRLFFTNFEFFKKYGEKKFFEMHDKKIKREMTNVSGYDFQLRFLNAAQKNAKLAGVDKYITLSKKEVEWMDMKFGKNNVDFIISDPPRMSKHKDVGLMRKIYNELFYQAEYILKKTGKVVLLAKEYELLDEYAKTHKFKLKKQYSLNQGRELFNILVWGR